MTLHHNGLSKMVFVLIFISCLITSRIVRSQEIESQCLTGSMTDIQSWVDKYGRLTSKVDLKSALDMSGVKNPLIKISNFTNENARTVVHEIKYLSMAKCGLQGIPAVFSNHGRSGRILADTLEYITFYGNNFNRVGDHYYDVKINATNAVELKTNDNFPTKQFTAWGNGFKGMTFKSLKELDLRSCAIQTLGTNIFNRMINLTSIYLSENNIFYIQANTFSGLTNLKHLDLSRNSAVDLYNVSKFLVFETIEEFEGLKIESLDFSFTPIGQRNLPLIRSLGSSLKRLSLCYSGLSRLKPNSFDGTSIKYLDLSGNNKVLHTRTALGGLEKTLIVLYAEAVGMRNMDSLLNLSNLEILKLTSNEITAVPQKVAANLKNLQVLDLSYNRIISWFTRIFSCMPQLKLLLLKDNNINIVSQNMYKDIENVTYIGLSNNFVVCSCYVRDMFEVGLRSEMNLRQPLIEFINNSSYTDYVSFYKGINDFNDIILNRYSLNNFCDKKSNCQSDTNLKLTGNYFLLLNDYINSTFDCLLAAEGKTINVHKVSGCTHLRQDTEIEEPNEGEWNKVELIIIPALLLPCLLFTYFYRKKLRYFVITIRNSTMLSLISEYDSGNEATNFNYDVFVSYCNEDRAWVLDHLLPHVEKDCNISVCLHERDFQVGLSILENIVSCMDRSRSIMLIISKRFLLSQWCQFEMHLAQHRLLETRREDLILVLLEEIPRRIRPNTLHYLMLTKTYIVWPKEETEKSLFWKRMNKSIITLKSKHSENVLLTPPL